MGLMHDPLFKTLLRAFFPEFLYLVSPEVAAKLHLRRAAFLDKELFTDETGGGRREVDLLARLPVRGSRRSLLVHVEIESRARKGMARRLHGYSIQIQARHGGQVLSIVLNLRGGRPGICVNTLEEDLDGPQLATFRYVAFSLAGCSAEEYLERPEPLAWGLAALMNPGSMSRVEHKLACLRRIAAADLTDQKRFLLVNCVETYLELTPRETAELTALRSHESDREVHEMRMTWADRMEAKGRQEALRSVLLYQLGQRFGPLPERVRRRIETIRSMERLTRLTEQVLVARSLDEMELN